MSAADSSSAPHRWDTARGPAAGAHSAVGDDAHGVTAELHVTPADADRTDADGVQHGSDSDTAPALEPSWRVTARFDNPYDAALLQTLAQRCEPVSCVFEALDRDGEPIASTLNWRDPDQWIDLRLG